MMRIAVHTRVLADRIAEYEAAHREVPAEPTAAIRSAGAKRSSIWRSGIEQFHLIGCEDCARLLAELEGLSVSVAWQTQMAGLLMSRTTTRRPGPVCPRPGGCRRTDLRRDRRSWPGCSASSRPAAC
jgi:L-rhamnose mutarotase